MSGGEDADWELVATLPDRQPATPTSTSSPRAATPTRPPARSAPAPTAAARRSRSSPRAARSSRASSASHPSASCVSNPVAALGLQHDVEATPKGGTILNTFNPSADTARGAAADRRHRRRGPLPRPGRRRPRRGARAAGSRSSTSPTRWRRRRSASRATSARRTRSTSTPAARTSPTRSPPTAVNVTDGKRQNEVDELRRVQPRRLRGRRPLLVHELPGRHEPAGQARRAAARRSSATATRRSRWRRATRTRARVYGCHELEVYPDDRLTCGSGQAADRARHEGRVRRQRHAGRLHRRQAARHAAAAAACATSAPPRRSSRPARRSPTASTATAPAPTT